MKRGRRTRDEEPYHGHRVRGGHPLPPVITAKIIKRDGHGHLVAQPLEWNGEAAGPAPQITVLASPLKRRGPAPGFGDVVLLRVQRSGKEADRYVARVLKRIGRAEERRIGLLRIVPHHGAHIEAVEKRAAGLSWHVKPAELKGAEDGDLVAFEATTPARAVRPMAKILDILGRMDRPHALSTIAIAQHGLPFSFSSQALNEARLARVSKAAREDWRALPLITIDPKDARDHDDAVHATPDTDPKNPGGFVLTIAIADVAAFVPVGSALDGEARERGNSVYFPDQVVPMLPEHLSNGLCSLKAGEERAALAMRITIDAQGRKLGASLHRILMRAAAKLAYEEAQAMIDHPPAGAGPLRDEVLVPLWAAYRALAQARDKRGPLALDLKERKLVLDDDGRLQKVVTPARLEAHRLIEEFMITANVAAAEMLEEKRVPLLYRVHDQPSLDRLNALRDFLATLDITLAKGQVMKPSLFNRVLGLARGTNDEMLINEAVLRTQAQAEYSTRNLGHFGLNLGHYAHFTSPIRRYADLMVHRSLIRAFKLGDDGMEDDGLAELDQIAAQVSLAERRATIAERETADRIITQALAGQIGEVFAARISGMTRAGLFVTLKDTGADGLVPMNFLGRDEFKLNERAREISGRRSGLRFKQGDEIEVRLLEASPIAGALRFEVLPKRREKPNPSTRAGGKRLAPARAKQDQANRRASLEGGDENALDE